MLTKQNNKQTSRNKLNVAKIFLGSLVFPWHKRIEFSQALLIPLLGLVSTETYWFNEQGVPGFQSIFFSILFYLLCLTIFAVRTHRLILTPAKPDYKLRWTQRERRFLAWLLITVLSILAITFLCIFIANIIGLKITFQNITAWTTWIMMIPAIYLFARISLIFPAAALDRQPTLRWAWALSKGNGIQLTLITALLPLTLFILTFIRKDPNIVILIFNCLVIYSSLPVVAVAALSLAYKELSKNQIKVIKPK